MSRADWQQRVLDELVELDGRLVKLHEFLQSDKLGNLDETDLRLLSSQKKAMDVYKAILVSRVGRFPE